MPSWRRAFAFQGGCQASKSLPDLVLIECAETQHQTM